MRWSFFSMLLLLSSCSLKSAEDDEVDLKDFFPAEQMLPFEGQIPFDSAKYLHLEIHLTPGNIGEGKYVVHETVVDHEKLVEKISSNGLYNIFMRDDGQRMLILQNTARDIPLRRIYPNRAGNLIERNFRNTDLSFFMDEDRLQLLDGETLVASDPRHFLYYRTTPVFTVEGYFMYQGDTSAFYEINTKTKWPLTKLGNYDQAAREHNTLADKKNDTTYLKATAYCVTTPWKKSSKKINALVLQRIIQSSTL